MFAAVKSAWPVEMRDFADEDASALPAEALAEELVELRRAIDRLEYEFVRRLQPFDRLRGYEGEGAVTLVGWLRWKCHLRAGAASERVTLARHLPALKGTEQAFAAGEISYHHAAAIAHAAEEVGADVVSQVEPSLLESARKLDPQRLRLVTRHLRHCVDADGALAEHNLAYDRRRLYLSEWLDGVFFLDGLLDAEGGTTLRSALNALLGPRDPADERTGAQRRADALVELARGRLESGDLPDVAGQRPHLIVTAPLATLRQDPMAPAGDLDWAAPMPAEAVRRLACDASVRRVLLDPDSEPVDVGRATRTVPPALRRVLELRDRGCRFPGCDRPPAWTDGHHLRHWADGGETTKANVVLLCRRHHRKVHDEGWRLSLGDDGALVAVAPWWTGSSLGRPNGLAPPAP